MTIFDWLNEISYNKRSWSSFNSEDRESFNPYMINRFISMKGNYIDFVVVYSSLISRGKVSSKISLVSGS